MCGVPANAAPDMTGLGGKARMVTSTVADSNNNSNSSEDKNNAAAAQPAHNLLLEVSWENII